MLSLLVACSAGSPPDPAAPPPAAPAADAGTDAAPDHAPSAALTRCRARAGELGGISDVVTRLGALAPADGPCLVASLPRPLAVVATDSVTSAQPAASKASPRLFFLLPRVVLSVVPEGEGSKLLELGEWVTPTRTLKGELVLPVTAPLAQDAPFEKVRQTQFQTVCAVCHRNEAAHDTIAGAFVSAAYKPKRGSFVPLGELEAAHRACVAAADASPRCEMFHAVFDFGAVTEGAFAPEVETF